MARQRFYTDYNDADEDLAYGLLGPRVAAPVAPAPVAAPVAPAPVAPAAAQYITKDSPEYAATWRETDQGPVNDYDIYLDQLPTTEAYWRGLGLTGDLGNGSIRENGGDDAEQQARDAARSFMGANGLQYGVDPVAAQNALINGSGAAVAGSQYSVDDVGDFMRDAIIVAGSGMLGGPSGIGDKLYGLQGSVGAAAGGATVGGVTGGVQAARNGDNILKGAVRGAVTGGATGYLGAELGGLLGGGEVSGMDMAADGPAYWNGLPNVEPGLLTTSPTLPELSAPDLTPLVPMGPIEPITLPEVPPFDPGRLSGAPDLGLLGNGDPLAPDPTPVAPTPAPMPEPVPQPDYVVTERGVVDIAGNPAQTPALVPDPVVAAPPAPEPGQYRPSENYGDGLTGRQTGAYDSVIKATGSPELANAASNAVGASGPVGDAWDWLKANPQAARLIFAGLGATAGGSGGGGGGGGYVDSGYRPVITRNPTNTPQPNQPRPQQQQPMQGLISLPTTGQANDGAWRFMKGLI